MPRLARTPLLVTCILAACGPAEPEPDRPRVPDGTPAVESPAGDSVTVEAAPLHVETDPTTATLASEGDTGTPATPLELAALAAVLDVPVRGVERTQLRDTYTESRGDRIHEAIDILAERGTPVVSATDGRLLKMFDSKPGGLMIYAADSSNRFILLYGHLDAYAEGLEDGMALTRGQVIGYVGTTGNAPPGTPHLHFGILRGQPDVSWSRGQPVNPFPLLLRATAPR